jgi:signal transduction histidine kinase
MTSVDLRAVSRGARKLFANPQLWLTVFVAVCILLSFAYIAQRFSGIARDAQERLVNVRVGSLQDAFAPLSALLIENPDALEREMSAIAAQNPTIVEFIVARQEERGWIIVAGLNPAARGTNLVGYDFVLSLSTADPSHSFTVEESNAGERFFRTARAVTGEGGMPLGVILTRQTLSEADRQIAANIAQSYLVLFGILGLLLVLFFHHARIIDYTELYRRLKEVDQLKDDFVSMVSHELRSPLTIIRGYVEQLREKGASAQNAPELLKRIDEAAQAQNLLIGDILDVARIEQGRLTYEMKVFDTAPVVQSVCEGLTPAASAKGLSITCEIPDGARIEADENRIRQVITNFVSNAIKYSDKGSITVKGVRENDRLVIRVSDTGIGMSAEELKNLFGKFYRVPGERVRQEVGTGLGLWITKQLVEAMKGTVSVESIKGVGSHFIVSFPLARIQA